MEFSDLVLCSVCSALVYHVLVNYLGRGYVSMRSFHLINDQLLALEERFKRLQAKKNMQEGRDNKTEQLEQLKLNLPGIIEELPIDEKIKDLVRKLPPDLIVSLLKKERLL